MFSGLKKLMAKLYNARCFFVKAICCLLVIVSAITISATPVFADGDEEKYEDSLSIYKVTVAVMDYVNDARKDGNFPAAFTSDTCTGNAGAAAGYSKYTIFTANNTNASSNNTYNSYDMMAKTKSYAQYGYILNELGLDACTSKLGMGGALRVLGGGIVLVLFILSVLTPVIFKGILTVLKLFNPFRLFADVALLGGEQTMKDVPTVLQPLANLVSTWYTALSDFSWEVMVPIFFAMLVVSLLLFKSTNKAKKIKKYVIRIMFIVVGIPLLGGTYTSLLDCMGDMAGADNSASTKVIASTFFDFESWAANCRLSVPKDNEGVLIAGTADDDSKAGLSPSALSQLKVRETCYTLNKLSGSVPGLDGKSPFAITSSDETDAVQWDTNALAPDYSDSGDDYDLGDYDTSSPLAQQRAEQRAAKKQAQAAAQTNNTLSDIRSLLFRYMSGSYYEAGMYSSDVGKQLDALNSGGEHKVTDMMELAVDAANYKKDTIKFTGNSEYDGFDIFSNGSLQRDKCVYYDEHFKPSATVSDTCGLSTLSMYNYLNTGFTNSGLTFYSGKDSPTEFARVSHPAVNIVGTGITSFLYWANCVVLLGMFAVIGLGYALGMLFSNVRRTISTISQVPLALLGSIRAIASVITQAVVMIIEIIGTIFVYDLVIEIALSISTVVCGPIMTAAGTSKLGTVMAGLFLPSMLLFSTIINLWFIKTALKMRKTIVKSLDEGAKAIIEKFLDVKEMPNMNMNNQKQPGVIQQAAGAVATGAGMAVGNNILRGVTGGDNNENVPGSVKGAQGEDGNSSAVNGKNGVNGSGANGKNGNRIKGGANPQLPNNQKDLPGASGPNGPHNNGDNGGAYIADYDTEHPDVVTLDDSQYEIKDADNDANIAQSLAKNGGLDSNASAEDTNSEIRGVSGQNAEDINPTPEKPKDTLEKANDGVNSVKEIAGAEALKAVGVPSEVAEGVSKGAVKATDVVGATTKKQNEKSEEQLAKQIQGQNQSAKTGQTQKASSSSNNSSQPVKGVQTQQKNANNQSASTGSNPKQSLQPRNPQQQLTRVSGSNSGYNVGGSPYVPPSGISGSNSGPMHNVSAPMDAVTTRMNNTGIDDGNLIVQTGSAGDSSTPNIGTPVKSIDRGSDLTRAVNHTVENTADVAGRGNNIGYTDNGGATGMTMQQEINKVEAKSASNIGETRVTGADLSKLKNQPMNTRGLNRDDITAYGVKTPPKSADFTKKPKKKLSDKNPNGFI